MEDSQMNVRVNSIDFGLSEAGIAVRNRLKGMITIVLAVLSFGCPIFRKCVMMRSQRLSVLLGLTMLCSTVATQAASILVFGDSTSIPVLTSDLESLGHSVTDEELVIPADLSGFDTIWALQVFSAYSATNQARLVNFIDQGGGVYFTGENDSCCAAANASVQYIIRSIVSGGSGITVGGLGDVPGPYSFNPVALDGIGVGLGAWYPLAPGGVTGIAGPNVLTSNVSNVATGGVWDSAYLSGSAGQAALLMDSNWFNTSSESITQINAIETFLEGGDIVSSVPLPAALPLFAAGVGLMGALGLRRKR
jgi:hypothetical protein